MTSAADLTAAAIEYGQLDALCESARSRFIHARESDRVDAQEQLRRATDRLYSAMYTLHAAAKAYRKTVLVDEWGEIRWRGGEA